MRIHVALVLNFIRLNHAYHKGKKKLFSNCNHAEDTTKGIWEICCFVFLVLLLKTWIDVGHREAWLKNENVTLGFWSTLIHCAILILKMLLSKLCSSFIYTQKKVLFPFSVAVNRASDSIPLNFGDRFYVFCMCVCITQ